MCGIAGILGREQWEPIDRLPLERLCHSLYHRGPDYQDIWSQPGIGLIHTRLSIIDLNPRSHQPMVNPENDQVIVFNGEIYNYLELRSELETLGYHFQTFSDTEVILKAYAHWREACLSRFNGMWAFAIYDPKTGSLFCSRDRYGVKPFVYGFNDQNQFVFASEHKALCSAFKEFRAINRDMMRDTLNEGMSFTPYQETLYQRVFHLLPGHWIHLTPGDTEEAIKQSVKTGSWVQV